MAFPGSGDRQHPARWVAQFGHGGPSLARNPGELTAGNVMTGSVEGISSFVGPAVAGLVLLASGVAAVFFAAAVGFVASAAAIARLPAQPAPRPTAPDAKVVADLVEGFSAITRERRARLLVGLFAAQMLVAGALNVLVVVAALRLLDAGRVGVGYLSSAVGLGGMLGLVGGAGLVGSRRLTSAFGFGLVHGAYGWCRRRIRDFEEGPEHHRGGRLAPADPGAQVYANGDRCAV